MLGSLGMRTLKGKKGYKEVISVIVALLSILTKEGPREGGSNRSSTVHCCRFCLDCEFVMVLDYTGNR